MTDLTAHLQRAINMNTQVFKVFFDKQGQWAKILLRYIPGSSGAELQPLFCSDWDIKN